MTAARLLLALAGAAAVGYGATLLLAMDTPGIRSAATWLSAGVLVHDLVFAPLCAVVAGTGRRLLPHAWWTPVAYGALCTVTLLILATPVLGQRHRIASNPTVLDRPYIAGLIAVLALVWTVVAIVAVRRRRRAPGHASSASPRPRSPRRNPSRQCGAPESTTSPHSYCGGPHDGRSGDDTGGKSASTCTDSDNFPSE